MYHGNIKNNHPLYFQNTNGQILTPVNKTFNKDKSIKKVKFNRKVDVVRVESYKEFNKIDEQYFNPTGDFFQTNNFDNKQKKYKEKNCNCCNIF